MVGQNGNTGFDEDIFAEQDRLAERAALVDELLERGDLISLRESLAETLECAAESAKEAVDKDWVRLVNRVMDELGELPEILDAIYLLFARTIDLAAEGSAGNDAAWFMDSVSLDKTMLLENAFFPKRGQGAELWTIAGADRSYEAGIARARKWAEAETSFLSDCSIGLVQTESVFTSVAGFSPEHLTRLLSEEFVRRPSFSGAGYGEMGKLLITVGRMKKLYSEAEDARIRILNYYEENYKEPIFRSCMERIGKVSEAPDIFVKELEDICASLETAARSRDGSEIRLTLVKNCVDAWLSEAKKQYAEGKTEPALLPDEKGLHERLTKVLIAAKNAGCAAASLRLAYTYACRFMCSPAYSFRKVEWFREFPGISEKAEKELEGGSALITSLQGAGRFLSSGDHTHDRFAEKCGKESSAGLHWLIMELYEKKEIKSLDPEFLVCANVLKAKEHGEADPNAHLRDAFSDIIAKNGCRALGKLLDSYPSSGAAEESAQDDKAGIGGLFKKISQIGKQEEEEYVPRVGKDDSWMILSQGFFSEMEEAFRTEKDAILKEFELDPSVCPELLRSVYSLAPARTVFRSAGGRVCDILLFYWDSQKRSEAPIKKEVNELRRKCASGQNR